MISFPDQQCSTCLNRKKVQYLYDRGDGMPKIKTHRGAAKRFSVTGTGKIRRSRANTSHILTPKTTKRKRQLRKSVILDKTNEKAIRKLIPYL
jgi:large subunit ribosomal protein L35